MLIYLLYDRESILVSDVTTNLTTAFHHPLQSISSTKPGGQIKNQIAAALVQRIIKAAKDGEKFKVVITPYFHFLNPENDGLGYCCYP
jgi:hypothetical protein